MDSSNKDKMLLMELAPTSVIDKCQKESAYKLIMSDTYKTDLENKVIYYDKKITLSKLFSFFTLIMELRTEKFDKFLISTRRIYNTSGLLSLEMFSILSGAKERKIIDLQGNIDKPGVVGFMFFSVPSFILIRAFEFILTNILKIIVSIMIFTGRKK